MKPADLTRSSTPIRWSKGMFAGSSDSPMWKRGKASRSTSVTRRPPWARQVAAVEPPGPPPITSTSTRWGGLDMTSALPSFADRGARSGMAGARGAAESAGQAILSIDAPDERREGIQPHAAEGHLGHREDGQRGQRRGGHARLAHLDTARVGPPALPGGGGAARTLWAARDGRAPAAPRPSRRPPA